MQLRTLLEELFHKSAQTAADRPGIYFVIVEQIGYWQFRKEIPCAAQFVRVQRNRADIVCTELGK